MEKDTIASFYKFSPLKKTTELRKLILEKACDLDLKGTILIAEEGLNGMISGADKSIKTMQTYLSSFPEIGDVDFKLSYYDQVAFRRMLVKIKKETITMRKDVDPLVETGHYLDPVDFESWIEEGKDMTILDTRNDYEVSVGTFEGAIDPKIKSFEDFTHYIDSHAEELKKKPVVTFCTGGIRCEKATAYMKQKGIDEVYQLEGGILKYFEAMMKLAKEGHWNGDCVVFDKRKAITTKLQPSSKHICYVCLFDKKAEEMLEKEAPGGTMCKACDKKITAQKAKKKELGLKKAAVNFLERKQHLKEVHEKKQAEFSRA